MATGSGSLCCRFMCCLSLIGQDGENEDIMRGDWSGRRGEDLRRGGNREAGESMLWRPCSNLIGQATHALFEP